MKNFNLLITTGTDYEDQAKPEIWFNLLSLGDEEPIIFKSSVSGLILADTQVPPRKLIRYLRNTLKERNLDYTQYIQKIYPIDRVVETDLTLIQEAALELIGKHPYCQPNTEFRITIRKRRTNLKTNEIIASIADHLNFPVNLQSYDWNLQIEIIGNITGMAIIKEHEVFRPNRQRQIIAANELQAETEEDLI